MSDRTPHQQPHAPHTEAAPHTHGHGSEPDDFAVQIADSVESFVLAVTEVAKGDEPGSAVSLLLLEVSQLLLAGGRLGAIEDVVPDDRFEPDAGPEPDGEQLREHLAALLAPIDVYHEVFDPYGPPEKPNAFRISDDLAGVVGELQHGLTHYREGRVSEALWWWQFSYLSNWGTTCSAVLRALQSLIAHVRLDSPIGAVPDGADTDDDGLTDEQLEQQAGDLMAAELGLGR
ncbi:DUF5063 domain-containing protein [Streptomyces rubellomurinus]|uniref:DUF5063 domain-containing protein n=2 Tax=Streptomyces TaxID=1883 RepID=A0A0F2TCA2_STRR3|nr:DUF5063 domain-containing protein [Streptomyces rubellomurinus]KJS55615.1 hypothetical protein VM98_11975 [Streptomyces rubellomurinus subsp. indigoferus]KJS60799.1 hypothetical protein VM95_18635 [Streptomyces rubellomurinus]